MITLDATSPNCLSTLKTALARRRQSNTDLYPTVRAIIEGVQQRGDVALTEYTQRFDRHTPASLRLSQTFIEQQAAQCKPAVRDALALAARRIRDFHSRQLAPALDYKDDAGVRLGMRWTAIDSVGLYVPGGLASYPSSVLMNAIPAKVAGVQRIAMVVPMPDGKVMPSVLAAAQIAGVDEIYGIGGAQAIAALAYGTKSITAVDKIVGPGNAYVAEAKRQVFGQVGIDSIAGPSEILVVADNKNDPEWIAWDLLSQAEHDTDAQSILITDDAAFAERVVAAVQECLKTLPRRQIAEQSWRDNGIILLVKNFQEAVPYIDVIAAEHLLLAVDDHEALFKAVRHAGSIFLGRYTPEAVGDYLAGPNHVLPTVQTARFSSGLSVYDFLKRTTFLGFSVENLQTLGVSVITLAEEEGLTAHAGSVKVRLGTHD